MKIDELKFVRLNQPGQFDLIPPKLLEQVKGNSLDDTERLREFGRMVIINPLAFIYVLVDPTSKIQGLLWFELSIMSATFHIRLLSLDKKYQDKKVKPGSDNIMSRAVKFVAGLRPSIEKRYNFKTKPVILAESTRPRYCEKYLKAKRCKSVSIEIPIGDDNGTG